MRGRFWVTFQGRQFESHNRGILQFYVQRKRGRIGPKISVFVLSNGKTFDFGSQDLGFDPRRLRLYDFWCSYLLFAFRREVAHLISTGLDRLGRLGSI